AGASRAASIAGGADRARPVHRLFRRGAALRGAAADAVLRAARGGAAGSAAADAEALRGGASAAGAALRGAGAVCADDGADLPQPRAIARRPRRRHGPAAAGAGAAAAQPAHDWGQWGDRQWMMRSIWQAWAWDPSISA